MKDFGINRKNNIGGRISEYELDKVNKDLGYRAGTYTRQVIDPKYLKEMVMDVYHNPSKYTDIISKLMDRYD